MAAQARRDRRQAFVDAAWRGVARKRYRELTVADVCAEAGLSKGSFYTHFGEKDDLLLALLDDDSASVDALIATVDETPASPIERLRRYVDAVADAGEDPARVRLRAEIWTEVSVNDNLRRHLADAVGHRRAALAGWITAAVAAGELVEVPANALAATLLALADGLMVHASVDPQGFRWANVRLALAGLLDGLRPPDRPGPLNEPPGAA